jgi:bacterioferritin-associated ferredoxin
MANWAELVTANVVKTVAVMEKTAPTQCGAEVVCRCLGVTSAELESALDLYNAESVEELREQTGAGSGCTACHRILKQVLSARSTQFGEPV